MWIVLFEFDLMLRDGVSSRVENEESRAGRSIVNGPDEDFVSGLKSTRSVLTVAKGLLYYLSPRTSKSKDVPSWKVVQESWIYV